MIVYVSVMDMAPCQLGLGTFAGQGAMCLSVDVRDHVDQLNPQLSSAEQQRYDFLRAVPRQAETVTSGHWLPPFTAFPGQIPGARSPDPARARVGETRHEGHSRKSRGPTAPPQE